MTDNKRDKLLKKYNITIDESLDEKYSGKVLFPKKLAEANEMLREVGLPDFAKLEREEREKEAQKTSANESTSTD